MSNFVKMQNVMKTRIPISLLELALITQGSDVTETMQKTKELAQLADELGYKRIWLAEHHNMAHVASTATVVLIGFIAGQTKNIRVGSGGIMLPNHSPLIVAEQFGTLGVLYPNRIDLGLGRAPGTDGLTAQAIRTDFYEESQRFPKNVSALQDYFSVENATSKVRAFPAEGVNVPIWILGSSMDSATLAAAYGLPYAFAGHFAPQMMESAFEIYHQNYKPSAEFPEPYTIACVNGIAANTDDEAKKRATTLYQAFVNLIRNDRKPYAPPVNNMDEIWNQMEKTHVTQMLKYSFIGGKETVKNQISEFQKRFQVDELMITSHIYEHQARLQSYEIIREAADDLNA